MTVATAIHLLACHRKYPLKWRIITNHKRDLYVLLLLNPLICTYSNYFYFESYLILIFYSLFTINTMNCRYTFGKSYLYYIFLHSLMSSSLVTTSPFVSRPRLALKDSIFSIQGPNAGSSSVNGTANWTSS